ncbi:MAG: S49 family peptidase [Gemmataceae bacterium]
MRQIIATGVCLVLLAGCMPLRTESAVQMQGKMEARVRSEVQPLVDVGPLCEVAVPPVAAACPAPAKVAVLDVDGVLTNYNNVGPFSLGENPVATFKEKLDACAADPTVRAVVLRLNTPGGGVAATDLMWHELVRFRQTTGKPVVACLLDLGTGGGYFLATGCDQIVAIPSSVVGGFGVVMNMYDANDALGQFGWADRSIRSGDKIDMGSLIRKLKPEERTLLTDMARGYHERFKQVVTQARPRMDAKSDLFDGRVMTSQQALQAGLIDAVGYLDEAIALACRLGKTETAQTVMYRRQGDSARTLYASTPNRPVHTTAMPASLPGLDRTKLPLFLYMWLPDPTMLRLTGL